MAIARQRRRRPDALHLALRGSGQALYVGLADDGFIVASEPYGVVEETTIYLRMDGETPAGSRQPDGQSRARSSSSTRRAAGDLDGIRRWSYDGTELPVGDDELADAPRSPPATSTAATSRTSS